MYDCVSNGAYKAGFANSQLAYESAYDAFFEAIDRLELLLTRNRCVTRRYSGTSADALLVPQY